METRAVIVKEFGALDVLTNGIFTLPELGEDEILIKVYAVGVNPVDTYIRSGQYKTLPNLPYIPGKDGAGIIEKVGTNIVDLNVGDRVYFLGSITGSYAEYSICRSAHVYHLPDNITFEQGACLGTPAFTAYRALFAKGYGKSDDLLFIHGASGGVGLVVVEMAKSIGMKVIGTAGTTEGIEAVSRAGAIEVFNHQSPDYIEQIRLKYPQGFDICIEMLASSNLGIDLTLMGQNGRVVIVGSRGPVNINPRDIMAKELQVTGVMLFAASTEELRKTSNFVEHLLRSGQLNPIASLILPLSAAAEAHQEVIQRSRIHVGNIVLSPFS